MRLSAGSREKRSDRAKHVATDRDYFSVYTTQTIFIHFSNALISFSCSRFFKTFSRVAKTNRELRESFSVNRESFYFHSHSISGQRKVKKK
jgi:hypothetical protein